MQGWAKISALGLIALLVAAPAFAGTVSYDDQSTFLSALSSSTTVNFDDQSTGNIVLGNGSDTSSPIHGITFSGHVTQYVNGMDTTGHLAITDIFGSSTPPNYLGTDDPSGFGDLYGTDDVTMTLSAPVTAFGLYVLGGFPQGSFTLNAGVGSAMDGTSVTFSDGITTGSYIGITSDTPFSSVTVSVTAPPQCSALAPDCANQGPFWNIDDVSYGTAKTNTPPPMPEPSSLVLLGTGLLAVVRRLKRA